MGHYDDCRQEEGYCPQCGQGPGVYLSGGCGSTDCPSPARRVEHDNGAPIDEEVREITNRVVEALGPCDMESALTVLCNLAGQVLAELSEGRPSEVQKQGSNIAENIKKAAIAKLLHDSDRLKKN